MKKIFLTLGIFSLVVFGSFSQDQLVEQAGHGGTFFMYSVYEFHNDCF